ncbi:MAG TPA: glycosyltransferase [Mycobacteriales bacterium]|nr:glycosyltransferase [Mycobacteriales bacterium]
MQHTGTVTVVVVNYRGAEDTIACLRAFDEVDWPRDHLQLVCVDNASGDGGAEVIRAALPHVKVVESPTNTGFAGGCNLGVAHASGEVVAFLNNDARPHRNWVSAAMAVLAQDPTIASVASKVLDWEGEKVDYVDGSLTWFGMGYKREVERFDTGEWDVPKDVLFGTGAAMFVRTEVFRAVGGFDERFFMFYEDVDLGWRLNLLGHRVRYEPLSLAYHRHHVTMKKFGHFRESYLLERNALLALYKNYGDEALAKALPAALALTVRRSFARTETDTLALDLQHRPGGDDVATVEVPKDALTGAFAVDYFVEQLPSLVETRKDLQARRRRTDAELLPLFRQAMEPAHPYPAYLEAHRVLVEAFGIEGMFANRRRIAVVTGEPLGARMAGPAIRAWEICRALSAEHDVQLVTLSTCALEGQGFSTRSAGRRELREIERWADVIVFQGLLLTLHPWLAQTEKVLVADIYDPFHLEVLEQERAKSDGHREQTSRDTVAALNQQMERADFMLCASAKQRDFWLGQLAALGRINPATYDDDENLENLLAVAPFGLPESPPVQRRRAIRGAIPGIGTDDKVILWGGGVYNWFDPLTLIRAVDRIKDTIPDVRLVFLGMKHPNPDVPEMAMADQARALAGQLGITGKHVFFNETWVAYDERADYLLDADLGVSCHLPHVETAFSFRTRILDYLWCGLPVVTTAGDSFAELAVAEGFGTAVPPEDVAALADALERLLSEPETRRTMAERSRAVAASFRWTESLAPLISFCRNPRKAPDLVDDLDSRERLMGRTFVAPRGSNRRDDMALLRKYLREEGMSGTRRRILGRLRKLRR